MHDPVALMSVFEPDVLLHVGKYHVDIETGDGLTIGRSVIDTRGRSPGQPGDKVLAQPANCTVALGADPAVFRRVLLATLAKVVSSQANL
jgi:inosine-uridine nucleoside N-ribohydrolase